jgi:hypothetical protein
MGLVLQSTTPFCVRVCFMLLLAEHSVEAPCLALGLVPAWRMLCLESDDTKPTGGAIKLGARQVLFTLRQLEIMQGEGRDVRSLSSLVLH